MILFLENSTQYGNNRLVHEIYIAADQAGPKWPWSIGYVTDMIDKIKLDPKKLWP